MDRRPLLVLGGSGQLGQALRRELAARGRDFLAPPRAEIDLLDPRPAAEWIERHRPTAVIYAAAYNDVARAELNAEAREVFLLNRDTPTALARSCRLVGARFVFLSSDFVFDGRTDRPYTENDSPRPLQVYGRSKLEGELGVRQADPQALIVRTSTLFGPGRRGRPNYVDAILAQARSADRIRVVRPPVASPTYTVDLAGALVQLLERDACGLFHVVNSGQCSRLELARETLRRAAATRVAVEERPDPCDGPRRPAFCALDAGRFALWSGAGLRPWQEALAEHILATGCRGG